MSKISRRVTATALMAGMVCAMPALATNGSNSLGFGTKDKGMGGAGVARATEAQSIVNNPAAVVDLPGRLDVSLALFSPNDRGYTLTGNDLSAFFGPGASFDGSQTSDDDIFAIPFFGYSQRIDNDSAWAITVSGLGGQNTNYSENFAAGLGIPGETGIDLVQMFIGATYGAKLANGMSWGVTLSYDIQRFEAKGLQAFVGGPPPFPFNTEDPSGLTDNGTDNASGIGLKVGLQGETDGGISWGASYRFKTDMDEFDKYKGLFPNQGDLDVAPTFTLGMAMPVGNGMTFALDYHFVDYEAVDAISNPVSKFTEEGVLFGADNGPGFGWSSISVIKAGLEIPTSADMTWRVGASVGEDPLESDEFSLAFLVPATPTVHLTAGFTKMLDETTELSGAWIHVPNREESGDFASAFGGGELSAEMEQNLFELSYSKLF